VKIYTKTGDRGTTSLFGGKRVNKNSARIKAYGEVDELNSWIGLVLSESTFAVALVNIAKSKRNIRNKKLQETFLIAEKLFRVQNELFVLGSDLAAPLEVKVKTPRITKTFVSNLEKEIDAWTKSFAPLKNFIIPGGGNIRSKLHLARTVARRAERSVVELSQEEQVNKWAQIYINRLSDWLFTLARHINNLEGGKEIVWKGRSKKF
jgi:cob(I)alamin adenosyltransferase